MGSAASIQNLPDEISKKKFAELVGSKYNEEKFQAITSNTGKITKQQFLSLYVKEKKFKWDVFLSHDWGQGSANHVKVEAINAELKKRGITPWFDQEQMTGDIGKRMAEGIEKSRCIIVFLTKNYMDKVNGENAGDNCQKEFNYATTKKSSALMIPVVMEPDMRSPGEWDGSIGFELSRLLYCDMCFDFSNSQLVEQKVGELVDGFIMKLLAFPLTSLQESAHEIVESMNASELSEQYHEIAISEEGFDFESIRIDAEQRRDAARAEAVRYDRIAQDAANSGNMSVRTANEKLAQLSRNDGDHFDFVADNAAKGVVVTIKMAAERRASLCHNEVAHNQWQVEEAVKRGDENERIACGLRAEFARQQEAHYTAVAAAAH